MTDEQLRDFVARGGEVKVIPAVAPKVQRKVRGRASRRYTFKRGGRSS